MGSLLHVATWARPDISFAVAQLARFQQQPTQLHWDSAKQVLRYLKGTSTLGVVYRRPQRNRNVTRVVQGLGDLQLHGFVDASWGEDLNTRRSQSAFVFMLGNGAVSWKSKLQDIVASSTCEAEYIAAAAAVKEAIYLRYLLADVLSRDVLTQPVVLLEDNQSTIKLARNLDTSSRTKHIDIRHHLVKDHVARGDVVLTYVPTEDQAADGLTKSLDAEKHERHRNTIFGVWL